MKRFLFMILVCALGASAAMGGPTVHFTTPTGAGDTWSLDYVTGSWELSFVADSVVVDDSTPADAALLGDYVNLPMMVLSNVTVVDVDPGPGVTEVVTAKLTPSGSLAIKDETTLVNKMIADLASGGYLTAGSNFGAYSIAADDIDITSITSGYSTVLDAMDTAEQAGFALDLSFSGDTTGADIVSLLKGTTGTTGGNLSGTMAVIPAPGAILLGCIGTGLVGWMRRRRAM